MEKKTNKILIITGGQIEDHFLEELVNKEHYSMMIAADSGLSAADRLKLPLDFIVGDFDSVPEKVLAKYRGMSTPIETFPTEKDKTDTQIALELALRHTPSGIDIAGGTGTRLDHTMANVHLLLHPMQLGITVCLIDSKNRITLHNKSFSIEKSEQYGQFVSLLPFTERVSGLTLTGFKYPLDHIILSSGSSLGISNEIVEETAAVELTEGILLVFETRD